MFITKKHLPRRAFSRAAGVTMALPLLDSMIPAQTPLLKTAANPKLRLGFCYIPHGAVMAAWTPEKEGAGFELSRILAPLKSVQDQVVVVSGLAQKNAGATDGDSGGDHGRSPSVFLNGARPRRTEGEDVRAGVTVDQIAAGAIGQDTPLPSMELATEDMTCLIGACDVGFSCTYTNTISWRTPTTPLPMEVNPRAVFNTLIGDGSSAPERLARIQRERGILDVVTSQVNQLQKGLSASDRNRVAEYPDSIREIERRIQLAEKQTNSNLDVPATPVGIPEDHEEHSKLMMDLIALAFEAEVTRNSSFMMAREVSYRTFPKIGVPDPSSARRPVPSPVLDKGADPKLANKDGLNALMLAAGVSWADKIRGTDAEALEAVKLCVSQGLDVNAATDKGDTALRGATGRGVNAIVKYLVENGAKIEVKNKQGFTPLDIALGKVSGVGVAPEPPKESTVALLRQLNQ